MPAMQETQVQPLGWEDPLEKEMVIHSSILAYRLPWTESLAGYSPWELKEWDTTERLHYHSRLTNNVTVSSEWQSTQSYLYMYPFSPQTPLFKKYSFHNGLS